MRFAKKGRRRSRFTYTGLKYGKKSDVEVDVEQLVVPEAALQKYCNDLLDSKALQYIRFPDKFLSWMKLNAPPHIAATFFKVWSGQPDNIVFIRLGNGLSMCLKIELKRPDGGRLHGKQIFNHSDEGWIVCNSTKQIDAAIEHLEREASAYRPCSDLPF